MVSSLDLCLFSLIMCGVMYGFCSREGQVTDFNGTCLSSRLVKVWSKRCR